MDSDDVISLTAHTLRELSQLFPRFPFAAAPFLFVVCASALCHPLCPTLTATAHRSVDVQSHMSYAVGGGGTHLFSWRRGYLSM